MVQKYLKKIERVLLLENTTSSKDYLAMKIITKNYNNEIKPYHEYFLYKDDGLKDGFDKLLDLCMVYDLSIFAFLQLEIKIREIENEAMIKAFKKSKNTALKLFLEQQKDISILYDIIGSNIFEYLGSEDVAIEYFLDMPQNIINSILDTTAKVACDELKKQDINLKKCSYDFDDAKEEIKANINILKAKFSNKKSLTKIKTSFLRKIVLDDFAYSKKYNALYFDNYQKGLSIGYSNRAFLMGVDKTKALRELKMKLKILEDYPLEDGSKLIKTTKELIKLTEQKKHKDKIPFKTIGKKLNMKATEVRNLIRGISTIEFSNNSFDKLYSA